MSSRRIFSYVLGPNPGSGGSLQNEAVEQIICWRFVTHSLFVWPFAPTAAGGILHIGGNKTYLPELQLAANKEI